MYHYEHDNMHKGVLIHLLYKKSFVLVGPQVVRSCQDVQPGNIVVGPQHITSTTAVNISPHPHRQKTDQIVCPYFSGLPVQVRDHALKLKDDIPKSDVNKEYYTQMMEKEVRAVTASEAFNHFTPKSDQCQISPAA